MNTLISVLQIIISIAIIILILLQQRNSDSAGFLGGGGGGTGGFYQERRGLEHVFFIATIVLVVLFAALALANLFIEPSNSPLITVDSIPTVVTASSTEVQGSTTLPLDF